MDYKFLASCAFRVEYSEVQDWQIQVVRKAFHDGTEMKRIKRLKVWESVCTKLVAIYFVGSAIYTFLCIIGWLLDLVS